MNVLGVLCFTAAVLTVSARHKKEWEFLDMKKATREILMPLYRSETPICHKGPGFYRDPTDCHQYIRCVDDFSSGRRLTLFVGRCRPGLVFDENISSCNWPELAAPCRNSPEHFKDTASKLNPKEPSTHKVTQDNKISDQSGYWNKYQSQQQKPNKQDQKLQKPVDEAKNVFQETETQGKIGQSFEDTQEPQVQITEQEREPQVAESFEEIPNNSEQQQIPITEQVREPVVQEKDEPLSQEEVIQQPSEPVPQNPDIRGQIKESHEVREPVVQEQTQQVQENPKTRQPVIQQQNEHVSKNEHREPINQQQNHEEVPVWDESDAQEKIYQPVVEEQTKQVQENPKRRQPVIQEQTQQVQESPKAKEPVIQQQNEHVSKNEHREPINQQQNHEEVPIWEESDSQEKIYQPIPDQEQVQNPVIQDTQRTNGQQQQNTDDNNLASQFQEQVPSGFFQEIPDSETSQSQWWVPEAQSSESTAILGIADQNDKHRGQVAPTTLEEPILCSNEGFFRHPKNCSRFIRCVKNEQGAFSVHFFQCAKHLFFDEKISHCTDSDNVKCPSRRTKRQADDTPLECSGEGFFRHPNDCRSFYRCVKHESGDYETHLFSCPANLVFDEEYATCNWPDKAPPCDTQKQFWKPTRASTSTSSRPSFKPYQRTTAKGYKSTSKPRSDFIESSNPFTSSRDTSRVRSTQKPRYTTQSSSSFGQLCNTPGFYRHDQDCTKFYKCVKNGNYFVRYELSCPKNYAYDEISSRCVSQKYASSCKGRNNYPPFRQNDEEPSTTAESDITDDDEQPPSENDGIECTEAGYFRNPNDCNKFYRCVDFSGEGKEFVRYDFSCPEGLVFDEKKSICNWPDPTAPCEGGGGGGNGEDESNVSNEEGESEESSSSTTPRSTTESERRSTTSTTPKKDKSTSRPKENTPKPGRSTSRPRENTPKPGRSTSRPKESTPKPERSTSKPEQSTPTSEESSKQPGESENGCNEEGFFRNPEDCNKFYRCVDSSGNGQEFLRYDFDCPEGLVFDEANSVCNWPDASSPCESSGGGGGGGDAEEESNLPDNESESEESSTTTTRKQTDESTSKPREGTSKPGRSTSRPREGTSKPSKSTSRPKEGTSKPGKSTSRPTESTPNPGKSTSSPREKTPQPGRSTSKPDESTTRTDESSKEPGESNSDNGCNDDGFFRNPEDCNKFYRCVDFNGDGQEFIRYDFDCPEGLVFDETNSVCNWPSEVDDCGSGSGGGSNKNKKESSTSTTQKGQGSTTAKPSTQKGRESTTSKPSTQKGRGSTTARPSTSEVESQTDEENPPSSTRTEEPESSSSVTESSSTDEESSTSSEAKRKGSSSNGECKEEGFFRNPDDCNKFYRCVDYNGDGNEFVKYDFSCPDGLVFDEENSVCNWPDQAAPCEGNSGKEGSANEQDENESSTSSTTDERDETSTTSTTRKKEEETSTTKRDESSTTRRTTKSPSDKTTKRPQSTKSPSGKTTKRPQSTKSPADKTTRRPQSTKSTTIPQSTTSSDESTGGSTATSREETTKDQTSESTKQESNGECTEEGFFRNPDDCGKFYRCVDFNGDGEQFVKYDFDCPDGLNFDEENSVCNWPEQSSPCETGTGTTSGGKGKTTESSSTTSKIDSTAQEAQSTSTTQSDESTSTTKVTSTTESTTKSNEPSSTTKVESTTSGKESDCSEPGFFRCKDDCNKFYRCVEEDQQLVRYDFKCPEGLIFDDKNKRCDFPSEELSCEIESTSTTPSSTQSTTQAVTQTTGSESTSGSTTTSATSSESSTKTTKECTEEGYFRDPDDCSKYYRCLDEGDGTFTREDFACAEDEVFDEEMRYCNRKDLAPPCEEGTTSADSQSTTSSGSSTKSSETSETDSSSSTSSETSETDSSSSTTPGESTTEESTQSGCRKEGFFRCEENCNNFYRCIDEDGNGNYKRYNFSCPEGLIFDEKNERCDWPSEELTCDTETTGSSTTSSGSTTSRGSTTSATSSGTTSSTTSSGSTSTASSDECTEEGYFRNPDDCSKYYRCLDEGDGTLTREDFSCAEDEVFDDEMNYCNRKDLAPPCEENSSSTTGSGTSTTQSGSTGTESESSTTEEISSTTSSKTTAQTSSATESSESTTNEENGSTKGATEGSTESSTKSGECEEEGFHRHPDDCNKFYRCVDFAGDGQSYTKYDFECPEGLVFDETNNVCNWPSSVPSCESSDSKSTTSSDTEGTSTTSDGTTTSTTQGDRSTSTTDSDTTSSSTTKKDSTSTGTTSGSTSEDTEGTDSSTTSTGTTSSTGSTSSDKKSEDAECTEEGFFRNPDDCTKFYRCVDFAGTGESYTRYDFECPDDLVFDEVNNVCNWPNMSPGCESRSKSEKNDSKSTTTAEEASSSTTESETNTDESQSTGTTAGGSTGTTSGESTTAGESSGTTSGDSTTAGESTGTTSGDSTTAGESTGTTSGDSTTSTSSTRGTSSTTSGTESGEFQCEDEGFFRHPKDCKKYYECKRDEDTGELIKIDCECPEGHVFDEEGWYCNAEELSPPCDDGSFKCEEEGFFRDPEDCTKYYQCNQTGSGFKKESFQCPDGNVFDEEGRYCNAPELTEPCNSTSSTSSSSGTTSSDQSTTPGSGTSSNPTSTTSSETSSTSGSSTSSDQQDCTEEGFFRNPEDCTKYYQCTRNEDSGELERKDFTCPDGRVFDEEVNYCNDPELSDKPCESSSTSSSTQGQTDSTTSSGTSTTEQTSATDSSTTGGTDSSTTGGTDSSTTGGTDSSTTGGTDSTTTGGTDSSRTTTTESSTTAGTDSSSSSTTTSGGSGTRRGGGDPECTQAGFFRHPKDCNKFYRCVDFAGTGESYVRYDFDCPEGLHFDEVNSTCNWPTMSPRCESESE